MLLLHRSIVFATYPTPKLRIQLLSVKLSIIINLIWQAAHFWRSDASTLSLYEGRKRQLMCSSWKFCVVLFTTERSATLTRKKKTPLKLKSRQRSSQVRRDSLSNKHSMTNPFSQMARPSHPLHKEWSQSIRLQSETTTPTWVMELQFWEKHTRSTKQTLQRLLKASWDKALPQWPLMCCTAHFPSMFKHCQLFSVQLRMWISCKHLQLFW